MPLTRQFDIDTSKPVLVTGATGYIAGVLIQRLLQEGLTVHATVRSLAENADAIRSSLSVCKKTKPLKEDMGNHNQMNLQQQLVFFQADLMQPDSFAKAMHGCSIVFHTASPFLMDNNVRDAHVDLIQPAVQGTENVLNTACQTNSVTRVVLTSSIAAMLTHASEAAAPGGGGGAGSRSSITEDNWNRTATTTHMPYCLSKTLAEQAAWIIAGGQRQWKLVVVNPSYCLGPGIMYKASSESYKLIQKLGSGDWETWLGTPDIMPVAVVDVRDVADAHLAAAFCPTASGRYIVHAQSTTLQELACLLAAKYGDTYPIASRKAIVPKWLIWLVIPFFPHLGLDQKFIANNMNYRHDLDASKSIRELGLEYRPIQGAVQDMYQQLIDAGDVVQPRKWYHWFMTA